MSGLVDESQSEELGPCLHGVLLAMILADDDIDPDEVAAAESAYAEFTGEALAGGTLAQEAAQARTEGRKSDDVLSCLPRGLPDEAKVNVLTAAFRVASADGFVLEEEDELLQAVARAIGMDEAKTRATLNGLLG